MASKRLRVAAAVVVVLAVVGVAAVGALVYEFTRVEPDSIEHTYTYELTIQPDERIENVTLYVPLPVENDSSPVGEALASGSVVVDAPANWSYRVVDTEYGPMLAVEADAVSPNYETRPAPRPIPEGEGATPATAATTGTPVARLDAYEIRVEVPADEAVDTADPTGSEPTLRPRLDARETACSTPVTDDAVCRSFDSRLRLSYDAPPEATTRVSLRYEGSNTWFAGGWTGNYFRQTLSATATGAGDGWVAVRVDEEVGVGNYPTPRQ